MTDTGKRVRVTRIPATRRPPKEDVPARREQEAPKRKVKVPA